MGYALAMMMMVFGVAVFVWLWRTGVRWMLDHDRLWRRRLFLGSAEAIYLIGALSMLASPEFERWQFAAMVAGSLIALVPLLRTNSFPTWLEPFFEGLDEGIENALRWR